MRMVMVWRCVAFSWGTGRVQRAVAASCSYTVAVEGEAVVYLESRIILNSL